MGCVESTAQRTRRPKILKKQQKQQTYTRLSSKFTINDLRQISAQQRRNGYKPAYACPICFMYFNKILACQQCQNFICLICFKSYEAKLKKNLKCSFCASNKSLFIDYQLQAHSYFDTTNKGFLSKQQRKIADQQMGVRQQSKLQPVNEEQEPAQV